MTLSTVLDVRAIPPAERHPALVLQAVESLGCGEALTIVTDHDPQRLRELLRSHRQGQFNWEDLEHGPPVWRLRLTKI